MMRRNGGVNSGPASRVWTLIGADGKPYQSEVPGTLGGHRRSKIYGRFDCRAAGRAIARSGYVSGYVKHRVFFLDEVTAIAAGYRPCAVCLPDKYAAWKSTRPPKQAIEKKPST